MSDEHREDDERYQRLLSQTRKRDAHLTGEVLLKLPVPLQRDLAALQEKLDGLGDPPADLEQAEEVLRELNRKLDDSFNMLAQLKGSEDRTRSGAKRRLRSALITFAVLGALGGAGWLYYQLARDSKAAECRETAACKQHGQCGAGLVLEPQHYAWECQAVSDDDCRQSTDCQQLGRCHPLHGKCSVQGDDECKGLPRCQSDGWCSASNGQCVAGSSADCQGSEGCQIYGRCSAKDGSCKVQSDADCQSARVCKRDGACLELGGECVKTEPADGG